MKQEIHNDLSRFGKKRVAIWGAGHQALAIMSLAELKDNIKYVVDSAPFKQDRYTPATHIPIVSPNALSIDPVDGIIVMAASYSDEIVNIIKRDYKNKMDVVVFKDFGLEAIKQNG
jgi:hypothetical protein